MPKKLDDCVQGVIKSGKKNGEAYAICAKSTGWVRGPNGTWVKKDQKSASSTSIEINENAVQKVGNLAGETAGNVLDTTIGAADTITNKPLEMADTTLKKLPLGERVSQGLHRVKEAALADPTKLSPKQNAKEWAGLMGAGSIASHIPALLSGDVSAPVVGALAAANAGKGALIGRQLSGGKDSLLKSIAIPAGTMAITTPLLNQAAQYFGEDPDIDFDPYARVGLVSALSGGSWALRNKGNKDKVWW
jgi:hypothetical protein